MKYGWLSALLAYCGFIFYLSHQPSIPMPALFPHQDKLFHMGAYGVMALLAVGFFIYQFDSLSVALKAAFVFCALYGISDEWHQSFVEGRQADVMDWLADCVGALIALWCFAKARSLLIKRSEIIR